MAARLHGRSSPAKAASGFKSQRGHSRFLQKTTATMDKPKLERVVELAEKSVPTAFTEEEKKRRLEAARAVDGVREVLEEARKELESLPPAPVEADGELSATEWANLKARRREAETEAARRVLDMLSRVL